jgi:cytochrome c oxidase assembly protein subunit 15
LATSEKTGSQSAYRFAVLTASFTVLLLIAGALVTSNQAADSIPDWPTACGLSTDHNTCLIPPMIGGIRFEYTHRVVAGTVAILTLILAFLVAATEKRKLAKRLGWTALLLVICQAVLGGIRVLYRFPEVTATAHAILAQIYFMTVVGLALYLSPWWQRELPMVDDNVTPSARSVAAWTTAVIFCQLILGAAFRHGALPLTPHLIGAGAVTATVVLTGIIVKKRFRQVRELRRAMIALHACFGIQLLLGGWAMWAVDASQNEAQPTLAYVIPTVAHVLGGALTFAASLVVTLACYRMIRPPVAIPANTAQGVKA